MGLCGGGARPVNPTRGLLELRKGFVSGNHHLEWGARRVGRFGCETLAAHLQFVMLRVMLDIPASPDALHSSG